MKHVVLKYAFPVFKDSISCRSSSEGCWVWRFWGGGGGDNGYSSTNGQLLYIKIVFQYEIRE